jgi:hypothetical protein
MEATFANRLLNEVHKIYYRHSIVDVHIHLSLIDSFPNFGAIHGVVVQTGVCFVGLARR